MTKIQAEMRGYQDSFEGLKEMMMRVMQKLPEPGGEEEDQSKGMVITEENGHQNYGKSLKFEVPHYDGTTDVEYWIFKLQEFFEVYTIPKEHWIKVSAYGWYMWSRRNKLFRDWNSFLSALRLRFGDSLYEDPKQALKELMQLNTVEEYQSEFETIVNKAIGLAKDWLISFFIGGLKEYIKSEVVLAKPTTYYETVSIAKLHEQRHKKVQQENQPVFSKSITATGSKPLNVLPISTYHSPIKGLSAPNSARNGSPNSGNVGNFTANSKALPYKRFTPAELKERRAKGLCYYCPEKYNRNHKCKPTYCVLIVEEDLEEFMHLENEGEIHTLQGMEETEATLDVVHILIDSGSTHNFVKSGVATRLNLATTTIKPFKVQTGSGVYLRCEKRCEWVSLDIQNQVFVVDLFVLDLKGADIVLGVQWLATLGDIVTNHKDLTMSFQVGVNTVQLRGDSLMKTDPINAKGIKQMFSEVFEEPKQLPPKRWIDHRIELKPEAKPVTIRPYSKKLNQKLSKASAYVRELYAITQAVMKWRHYLLGRRFTIKTDHKSLKELMHQVVQTPEQQFYLSKLLGFDFEIVYRTGRTNLVADALSRQEDIDIGTEVEGSCHVLSEVKSSIVSAVQKANKENEELQILHELFQKQQCSRLFTPILAEVVDEWLQQRETLQGTLKTNLQRAQDKMKRLADLKRKEKSFEVGQWVWVKFHPYKQSSVARRLHFKLARRFYGPFQIKGRVGVVAYRLELPSYSKVHPIFHVSLLKEYKGDPPTTQVELPEIAEPYSSYPTAIIAQRQVEVEGALQHQVLVEWSGSSRDEATWEDWATLVEVFPSINLEDKVIFQEGNVDTNQADQPGLGPTSREKRVRRPPYWAQDYT
ncbi:retrotransposon-related protein [Senna tora]|uniref:Retrotransposon-related protein n=1 Tax=Senna tora TaxID=362788 RepID=A0A834T1F6_9FABA|nr:retrotransposon-related protein [Senna tora]